MANLPDAFERRVRRRVVRVVHGRRTRLDAASDTDRGSVELIAEAISDKRGGSRSGTVYKHSGWRLSELAGRAACAR